MKNLLTILTLSTLAACMPGGAQVKSSAKSASFADSDKVVNVCVNPVRFGLTCSSIGKLEDGKTDVQLCTTNSYAADIGTVQDVQDFLNQEAGYLNGTPRIFASTGSFNNDALKWFSDDQLSGFTKSNDVYEGIIIASQDNGRAFLDDSCQ